MNLQKIVILLAVAVVPWPALAQDNAQVALQRAQGMLRQISSQKAALEAQVQQLQDQLAEAQDDLEAEKNKSQRKESKFKGAISEWKEEYSILREKYLELAKEMRNTVAERDDLSGRLQVATHNFEQCYTDNSELVILNEKLLDSYESKGVWAALSQREPVTGFGKVKIQNLIQSYRQNIEDLDLSMNQYQLVNESR